MDKEKEDKYFDVDDSYYGLTFYCMIKGISDKLERDDIFKYFMRCTMIYFIQMLVTLFVLIKINPNNN